MRGKILHDISPVVTPGFEVWPGDTPPRQEWLVRMDTGNAFNLSTLVTTVHLGSHADAPLHYAADGAGIEACPIEAFIGPARVVRIARESLDADGRIPPSAVESRLDATPPRVLFATGTYAANTPYTPTFASFHPGTIDLLASRGVVLVGIDTPSVDPLEDPLLSSHQRLAHHRMMNLEGLVLDGVAEGDYELVALPLRLAGFDASPVRAILRSLD